LSGDVAVSSVSRVSLTCKRYIAAWLRQMQH
jgi:hypothetical protein